MIENKQKSIFKFVLTDPRFTLLNKIEFFGFLLSVFLFLIYLFYNLFFIQEFTFTNYAVIALTVIYILKRVYPKFTLPYRLWKSQSAVEEKFEKETARVISGLAKETVKYEINLFLLYPLFLILLFLIIFYFIKGPTLKEYSFIIKALIILISGLLVSLFFKWSFKYIKYGSQSYKRLKEIAPPLIGKKMEKDRKIFLILSLAVIIIVVGMVFYRAGFYKEKVVVENCEKYMTTSIQDSCFKNNAKIIVGLDPQKAIDFCNKISSNYERAHCTKEAASILAKKDLKGAYEFCGTNRVSESSECSWYVVSELKDIDKKLNFCDIVYERDKDYICYLQVSREYPQRFSEICNRINDKKQRESCISITEVYRKTQ